MAAESPNHYDAIVIGGGHNGLVTAAYLGVAGLRTVVLERRETLGGAAGTSELAPGLGTWDDQREAFGDAVVDRIAEFAPKFRDSILFRDVQTPLDIERTTGLTEGNIFQGELSLEQLFFNRPVPGYARFRTPLRDLWLCGSSTHPGGGIMGANGRIAALEVLRARGRKVA